MRMFCFKEKKDIIDGIHSISNDVMINGLIEDLINHDGVTNFFWSENGCVLNTNNHERVRLFINSNSLHVVSNLDSSYQEINYSICSDQSKCVNYIYHSKVDWPDYTENRTLECLNKYDISGKILYCEKVKTSYLSSSDTDLNESLKKSQYENYKFITRDYSVGDNLLRVSYAEYFYDSDMNDVKYYIGLPTSGIVKYYPISYEEFMEQYSSVVDDDFVQKILKF